MLLALVITLTSALPGENTIYERYIRKFDEEAAKLIDFDTKQLALTSRLTPLETLVFVSNSYDKAREARRLLYLERARPVLLADMYGARLRTLEAIRGDWPNAESIVREALAAVPIRVESKKKMIKALIDSMAAVNNKQRRIHKYNIVAYDDLAILRAQAVSALNIADKNVSNLADYLDATIAVDLYLARLKMIHWKYAKEGLQSARDNAMFLGLVCILVGTCVRFATVNIFWFTVLLCIGSFFCWLSATLHWWTDMKK